MTDLPDEIFAMPARNHHGDWVAIKMGTNRVKYTRSDIHEAEIAKLRNSRSNEIIWFERETAKLRNALDVAEKALENINNICGTVNFSSHNQMRETIEGAIELSEEYVAMRSKKIDSKPDENGKTKTTGGTTIARREYALLSHAYTKAIEWGYISNHPFKKNVVLKSEKPRTRYIEDWEVEECLKIKPASAKGGIATVQAYIIVKLLTGLRQGDLLRLKVSDLKDDGIHVRPRKTQSTTGKSLIYEWSDELRKAVDLAKSVRPVDVSPYLFCNNRGLSYASAENGRAEGWATLWQNFMKRVIDETNVKDRFTEHDLRAKVASDADTLEHARKLLAHADGKMTERVYRRKAEKVKPLR